MSAFHQILDELVHDDGAAAAIFVDDSGETVDLATVEDSEEMRLLAAYAGIYLRQAERFCTAEKVGSVERISVVCSGLRLHAKRLRENYSLIVLNRREQLSGISRRRLDAAAAKIEREAFDG